MSVQKDVKNVVKNIKNIYSRRKAAVFAVSLRYAGIAINYFRSQQEGGRYWVNQTSNAKDLMFTNGFIEDDIVGWFMAHGVQYGVYLELANDRKNEAIRPIIQRFAGRFFRDVKEIYGDN